MGFFKLIDTYEHGVFHYYGQMSATLCACINTHGLHTALVPPLCV